MMIGISVITTIASKVEIKKEANLLFYSVENSFVVI